MMRAKVEKDEGSSMATATFTRLKVDLDRKTLRVVLARPETRNAFDATTIAELTAVFSQAGRGGGWEKAQVVLLSGEGPSFCSGADLGYMKAMAGFSEAENKADAERLFEMFESVRSCAVPVVVHAHGHAMGGALGIAACADIVLAETGTQFRFSEVRLGIIPAVISPFVLARMQVSWARRYMLTGEGFDAMAAREAGLVHFVGAAAEVVKEKDRVVEAFLETGPEAVKTMKALLRKVDGRDALEVRADVTTAIAKARVSTEGQEGLKSFAEKREPAWRAKK